MKVAIVERWPSHTDYSEYFAFDHEVIYLRDTPVDKMKKADIELDLSELDFYNYVILVGSEACKFVASVSSVTKYQGHLVNQRFLPMVNPKMVLVKPEYLPQFNKSVQDISSIVYGEAKEEHNYTETLITDSEEAKTYLRNILNTYHGKAVAIDTETYGLDYNTGYLLGVSISTAPDNGAYIHADCFYDGVAELLQKIANKYKCVFHNAKHDLAFIKYHLHVTFPDWEDTMLMHYCLNEEPGTHDLKTLAMQHTPFGDYEKELDIWKKRYCAANKIKITEFTYDLIPFEILGPYAAKDTAVTITLYHKFREALAKDNSLVGLYLNILKPGASFIMKMEANGVPFCRESLKKAQAIVMAEIDALKTQLYSFDEVRQFEEIMGAKFNPNSPTQIRNLLFTYLGLVPSGILTDTKEHSTNEESLEIIAKQHKIPTILLQIRKKSKILSTYLDKILIGLDTDDRLRTGFNLHTTTSGRLSSSGKLNMQQLPRDDPYVKGCIVANPGYKIVSQDLGTAEIYVAAVLSGDEKLRDIFRSRQDFHSTVGKLAFDLTCEIHEVKKLYPAARQASKTLAFAILYGSGPETVAEGAGISVGEAKQLIRWYFTTFPDLAKWLTSNQDFVKENGFLYSHFGRKRRVNNVFSPDRGVVGHAVRSAINFLVQSVASDINLLAAIEIQSRIEAAGKNIKIFALVHDSILAEVPEAEVDWYVTNLRECTQKDRGVSIPGFPVPVDVEIGNNYKFTDDVFKEAA